MNAPRKILYIDTALRIWGGQRSLHELISNLDRDRYVPTAAVPEGSQTLNLYGDLAEIYTFPAHSAVERRPTKPFPAFRSVISISRLIREIKPDVIHANTFLAALFVSLVPFLKVPWILHQRDFKDHGILSRWAGRRASKVITITKATAVRYENTRLKRPLTIITQGVDVSFTERMAEPDFKPRLRQKLGLSKDNVLVGTVATISARKSQHEVLEAADRLRDIPGLYFVFVGATYRPGDQDYLDRLLATRSELGLEDRVFFEDYTDDLADVFASIDIMAHPAKSEGLGRVIFEAMGSGVPILARGDCGPAEVIEPGVDGVLFEPDDFEDFVRKLRRLVEDEDYRQSVSTAGKAKVTEKFTVEKSTARIQEVYDELINDRR
jgi:glycosyltransferase involved in cell wall biosynthesis